jgi:anti-sigma factor RsiW
VHLDDDAELYALGLLDADRGAGIEAHLAACGECRTRVVAAEEAAAALAGALPPAPEPAFAGAPAAVEHAARVAAAARAWSALAVAAALVFAAAAVIEGFVAHAASARLAMNDDALIALAGAHFNHVTLTGERGVVAKALYARDGAWCYVVARGAPRNAHVVLRSGAATRDAGPLEGGDPATAFVRAPGRVGEIDVVADGRTVARAAPAY